jgi:cytochrome b561
MLKNTSQQFGLVSIGLHWLMALLLTGLFAVGLYMTSLDYYDPLYHRLPWWHKSIGLGVILLLLVRFVWKIINPRPAALASHKTWEVRLAHSIQNLFYGVILLMGVSGYLISTAKGKGIAFFGFFDVPAVTKEIAEETADMMGNVHLLMAWGLVCLVILHAAAALKHHFIDKDNTLKRMIN